MSQQELLNRVIQALDQVGIQYMITGSVASSMQGEPRSTHDIDIVITIKESRAYDLGKAFPPGDFYLDEHCILDAIKRQSMFNLIDLKGGSEKQFNDAIRVYEVQYGKLDLAYLNNWVKRLDVESLWKRLIDEAEIVE